MSNKEKKNTELNNWDWAKNDREYYEKFLKLPESKNKKYYQSMREQRFKLGDNHMKMDLRPRKFFSIMKVEIIILVFGIGFAITLPFYSKYLNAKLREPDEVSLNNIKSRVKSDPIKNEQLKEKLRIENKLKKEYTKDEEHEKIKLEIEKTLRELNEDPNDSHLRTFSYSSNKNYK